MKWLALLLLPSLLFSAPNLREAPEKTKVDVVQAAISGLQKRYENTKAFSSGFNQTYHQAILKKSTKSAGAVFYQKPGNMLWDYEKPHKKQFIVKDTSLIVFNAKDKSAFVNKCFKTSAMTDALSFLWGMGNVREKFEVSKFAGVFGSKDDLHLQLNPKQKNSGFKRLILVLDPQTFAIRQSIVIDHQDNANQFEFVQWQSTSTLSEKIFAFNPPTGVSLQKMPGTC